jgi:hypothetical protein
MKKISEKIVKIESHLFILLKRQKNLNKWLKKIFVYGPTKKCHYDEHYCLHTRKLVNNAHHQRAAHKEQ